MEQRSLGQIKPACHFGALILFPLPNALCTLLSWPSRKLVCIKVEDFVVLVLKNISLVCCTHSWNIFQHSKRNFASPRSLVISSVVQCIYSWHRKGRVDTHGDYYLTPEKKGLIKALAHLFKSWITKSLSRIWKILLIKDGAYEFKRYFCAVYWICRKSWS